MRKRYKPHLYGDSRIIIKPYNIQERNALAIYSFEYNFHKLLYTVYTRLFSEKTRTTLIPLSEKALKNRLTLFLITTCMLRDQKLEQKRERRRIL